MLKRLIATTAVAALALTACSGGTGAGTAGGSGGGGEPVKKIKLVAAEYSKDNTAAFWNKFAAAYKAKTGIDLDVQVVSWDDIDQQSSTMIQNNAAPDILNLNAYASYAKDGLLYSSDEVLSDSVKNDLLPTLRPVAAPTRARSTGCRTCPRPARCSTTRTLFAKAGIAAPPKTWDEFDGGRQEDHRPRRRHVGYAMPLGPEESQAEFSIWLFNNGGNWKTDGKWTINSPQNVDDPDVPQEARR